MKGNRSNCLPVAAKKGDLQKRLCNMEGKARDSVASERQLRADVSFMTEKGETLAKR